MKVLITSNNGDYAIGTLDDEAKSEAVFEREGGSQDEFLAKWPIGQTVTVEVVEDLGEDKLPKKAVN
jgi:hypothetical protein